ncbi:hypothetical protein [Paractinoplanes maris]|uniref:hypothetical protein n=1 Tax=Paractinoplanes maris TaxID=1734446 RepID=UPI002020A5A2|nr:hypothetical protein [Actinoplanes maris]
MTRTRMTLTITALGLTGVVAAVAVGAAVATPADAADETYALAALDDKQAAQPKEGRKAARAYLRKNTLHGEVVVSGKDGNRTIVVQRGTVTATTDKTLSVKSSDGFTLSWTKGDKLKVRGALKTGAEVGVAGAKDGDATVARLVRVQD